MSNLLSTTALVTECQTRVPIGLSQTYWMKKLNEAYRWVCQKGHFVWEVRLVPQTLTAGNASFVLPSVADPGKPMYLAGPYANSGATPALMPSILPYQPWEETLGQQFSEMTALPGFFSCWSYSAEVSLGPPTVYSYRATLYPAAAAPTAGTGDLTFTLMYHTDASSTELTVGATTYFPTPNVFDNLFIELAEAETRRIYGLAGWELIQKRAESGIMPLLDTYRSTKNAISGLVDQQKQTGERKMMAQERA